MRGAIQLMTQQTGWYQVVDRAVPVNVACHDSSGFAADSALRKEVILVLMSVTDWSQLHLRSTAAVREQEPRSFPG